MKKAFTSILVLALLMVILFTCTGCYSCNGLFTDDNDDGKSDYWLYTDYFAYDVCWGEATIYANSNKSLENDYLVIPDEIDGYPVTSIVNMSLYIYSSKTGKYTNILKKLYVSRNVKYFDQHWNMDCTKGVKIIFLGAIPPKKKNLHQDCYISEYVLDNYKESYPNINIANISYLYNYDGAPNQNVYFVDELEENDAFSYIPEEPIRDGYIFTGWYLDGACMEQANLEEYIYKEDYGNITFYAGWREIE
jgi:uncharacterized repeat protein (TIGR02543 family)